MDISIVLAEWLSLAGDPFVLSAIGVVVAAWLLLRKDGKSAVLMLLALGLTGFFSTALKGFFMRPRPDGMLEAVWAWSPSFPSAHAAFAAVFFLVMGYLLTRGKDSRGYRYVVWAIYTIMAVMIGLSRLILNVHWPSDVVAGWVLGALCFVAAIYLAKGAARHGGRHL